MHTPYYLNMRNSGRNSGFTLIELLVVVTLSIVLMLAASAIFMTFLISNTKTSTNQLVKSEGDFALSQMEFLLRNALELLPNINGDTCTANMSEIVLKSNDNGITTLFTETDNGAAKIASNSGVYLTSGSIELSSEPVFNCIQSADKLSNYVNISFTLRKGTPGIDQARDIVEETFTTGVNLRSF